MPSTSRKSVAAADCFCFVCTNAFLWAADFQRPSSALSIKLALETLEVQIDCRGHLQMPLLHQKFHKILKRFHKNLNMMSSLLSRACKWLFLALMGDWCSKWPNKRGEYRRSPAWSKSWWSAEGTQRAGFLKFCANGTEEVYVPNWYCLDELASKQASLFIWQIFNLERFP